MESKCRESSYCTGSSDWARADGNGLQIYGTGYNRTSKSQNCTKTKTHRDFRRCRPNRRGKEISRLLPMLCPTKKLLIIGRMPMKEMDEF
jgi:hypothetical protein